MKKSIVATLHIFYWALFALLLLTFYFFAVFVPAHTHSAANTESLPDWIVLVLFFAVLPGLLSFYAAYTYFFDQLLSKRRFITFLLASGLTSLAASTISAAIASLPVVYGGLFLFHDGYRSAFAVLILMSLIAWLNGVAGAVVKAALTWYREIRLKEELHRRNLETELALVKAQIDPHFLFNTLNNIDILIGKEPDTASLYLNKLSGLMRFLLYETKSDRIPLERELDYLRQYIELQKIRSSNKDYVQFEQTGDPAGLQIAPMLLLPFIENAFKHTESRKLSSRIAIGLHAGQGQLDFSCVNTLLPVSNDQAASGIGNALIRKRLELLYPQSHDLTVTTDEQTYSVKLRLTL